MLNEKDQGLQMILNFLFMNKINISINFSHLIQAIVHKHLYSDT